MDLLSGLPLSDLFQSPIGADYADFLTSTASVRTASVAGQEQLGKDFFRLLEEINGARDSQSAQFPVHPPITSSLLSSPSDIGTAEETGTPESKPGGWKSLVLLERQMLENSGATATTTAVRHGNPAGQLVSSPETGPEVLPFKPRSVSSAPASQPTTAKAANSTSAEEIFLTPLELLPSQTEIETNKSVSFSPSDPVATDTSPAASSGTHERRGFASVRNSSVGGETDQLFSLIDYAGRQHAGHPSLEASTEIGPAVEKLSEKLSRPRATEVAALQWTLTGGLLISLPNPPREPIPASDQTTNASSSAKEQVTSKTGSVAAEPSPLPASPSPLPRLKTGERETASGPGSQGPQPAAQQMEVVPPSPLSSSSPQRNSEKIPASELPQEATNSTEQREIAQAVPRENRPAASPPTFHLERNHIVSADTPNAERHLAKANSEQPVVDASKTSDPEPPPASAHLDSPEHADAPSPGMREPFTTISDPAARSGNSRLLQPITNRPLASTGSIVENDSTSEPNSAVTGTLDSLQSIVIENNSVLETNPESTEIVELQREPNLAVATDVPTPPSSAIEATEERIVSGQNVKEEVVLSPVAPISSRPAMGNRPVRTDSVRVNNAGNPVFSVDGDDPNFSFVLNQNELSEMFEAAPETVELITEQPHQKGQSTGADVAGLPLSNGLSDALQLSEPTEASRPAQLEPRTLNQIIQTTVVEAQSYEHGAPHRVRMRLNPPELGGITIEIRRNSSGTTEVQISADLPETQSLIDQSTPEISQSLNDQGFSLSQFDLSHQQQDPDQAARLWESFEKSQLISETQQKTSGQDRPDPRENSFDPFNFRA